MYCHNCGSEMKEDDRFCPVCGEPSVGQGQNNEIDKKHASARGVSVSGFFNKIRSDRRIVLALVGVVLLIIISCTVFQGGYKSVIKKYFKAIVNGDGDIYYSILADDYIDYMMSGWGYSKQELLEKYQESMEDELSDIQRYCGSKVTIKSQKITDVYKLSASELSQLNSWMETYYWFDENSIKDAVVVSYKLELKGPSGSCTYSGEKLVIKSHGKWCLTGGRISFSWYSQ